MNWLKKATDVELEDFKKWVKNYTRDWFDPNTDKSITVEEFYERIDKAKNIGEIYQYIYTSSPDLNWPLERLAKLIEEYFSKSR